MKRLAEIKMNHFQYYLEKLSYCQTSYDGECKT